MSRRFPRIRARLTATVTLVDYDAVFVCRTRDISERGCFLATEQLLEQGTGVAIALMDKTRGIALNIEGHVARCLPPGSDGTSQGIGVRFDHPPTEWNDLVATYREAEEQRLRSYNIRRKRLRVLIVGDQKRQRGAMALYVTSGWDVRFATDLDSVEDALSGVTINAVIAESDLPGTHWKDVLSTARRIQPNARRIVRSTLNGASPPISGDDQTLFHQFVDRDAGLDALVDALIATDPAG